MNHDNSIKEEEYLEKQVFEEIDEARARFARNMLESTRSLVLEIGRALEKIRTEKGRICQEIKTLLKEEISRHMISERIIEKYSLQEWKSPELSEFGRKGARQKKRLAEEISASANGKQAVLTTKEDEEALSSEQENSEIQRDDFLLASNGSQTKGITGDEEQEQHQPPTRVIEFGVPVKEVIIEGQRAFKEGKNALAYFVIELDTRNWRVLSASAGRLSNKDYDEYNNHPQLFSAEENPTNGGKKNYHG